MLTKQQYEEAVATYDHEYMEPGSEQYDDCMEPSSEERKKSVHVKLPTKQNGHFSDRPICARIFAVVCVVIVLICITASVTYFLLKNFTGT